MWEEDYNSKWNAHLGISSGCGKDRWPLNSWNEILFATRGIRYDVHQQIPFQKPRIMTTETAVFDREKLLALVHEKALEFGDFTLASGEKAGFYLDCRRLTLDGQGANLIAAGILDKLKDDMPDAVGGMAIGADPISAAVITVAWQSGRQLRGFIVRKEAKGHGTGRQVEGPVQPGDKVVMMEDVVTTGGSSLRAIKAAREFGLEVDRLIAIVDRGADSAGVFNEVGVKFDALVHVSELNTDPS